MSYCVSRVSAIFSLSRPTLPMQSTQIIIIETCYSGTSFKRHTLRMQNLFTKDRLTVQTELAVMLQNLKKKH